MNSTLYITIPSLIRIIEPGSEEFNIQKKRRFPNGYSEDLIMPIGQISEIFIN